MTKYNLKVPVFFTVDDNYIPYLCITLKSLIDHSKKVNKYEIYIVHNQLSEQSKKIVRRLIINRPNFTIKFINVSLRLQELSIRLDVRDYYTSSTYFRLFLPELFPFISKAIYIDSDIVLRSDIANLFATDLGDNLLGAVPDASVQLFPEFQKYVETVLGVPHDIYFNAGVLVMNFKGLREFGFERKAVDLLSNLTFKVAQDQDILNYLTKGRTKLLDARWNVMPLGQKIENPYLIHYNLIFKPWKHTDIMYEEYFWDVANKLSLGVILQGQLKMIPESFRQQDFLGVEMVKKMCLEECKKVNTYYAYIHTDEEGRKAHRKNRKNINVFDDRNMDDEDMIPKHNEKREEILAKIVELEKAGKFDQDVEDDPPYVPIEPYGLDLLRQKFVNKIKTKIANNYSYRYFNHLVKKGQIVIDGYEGIENLKSVGNMGAVITANHFNPFDSVPIHKVMHKYFKKKQLFKVIKEGNWHFPGLYGFFMRNCNTIPLSSNYEVLKQSFKAMDTVLGRGDFLLVYAEQSMWWNYRKPKPLKIGAFRFAAKNGVPVVPTFITMRDTDKFDADGYPIQAYTLHILAPIYPDPTLSVTENTNNMLKANEEAWKALYEKVYQIPLKYEK